MIIQLFLNSLPGFKKIFKEIFTCLVSCFYKLLLSHSGFTLAEILIALAILGVISTFTIPKILTVNTQKDYNAKVKEAAGVISQAYQQAQIDGDTSFMSANTLMNYLNYIRISTSDVIDGTPYGGYACGSPQPCYFLSNGSVIHVWTDAFCNSNNTAIPIDVDPDGVASTTTSPQAGYAVRFFLYKNGLLRTEGTLIDNTQWSCGSGIVVSNK